MAVAAILAPVGCSIGADSEPRPVSGVPKEIAVTVDRLERAIAHADYAEVCDRLFTAAARKRAGGPTAPSSSPQPRRGSAAPPSRSAAST